MAREAISYELYQAVLTRRNITWEPDAALKREIENSIEEARDFLRAAAGRKDLTFEEGEARGLLATAAWYFSEGKRADFSADYSGELTLLRLREGFGCGKKEN